MGYLFVLLVIAAICGAWIVSDQRARRRRALHAALFRPKIEIRCHNNPAEAGSSKTPTSLARSLR